MFDLVLSKVKKINLDNIIEAIWLLIVFCVPLYFQQSLSNAFEVPKNILFQSLTELLLFLFLIKIVLVGGFTKLNDFSRRIKFLIPAFLLILIFGLSTMISRVPWFSFWGSWERRLGYLAWLHFFIFFSILLLSLKDYRQIKRIFFSILISAFLVCVYGIAQSVGFDPWDWNMNPRIRIFSSIGQPNFLGSWLLLVLPLACYFFWRRLKKLFFPNHDRPVKNIIIFIANFILIVLLLTNLYLTQSRGAWIGIVFMAVFIFSIFLFVKNKKLFLVPILLLLIFAGIIFYFNYRTNKGLDYNRFSIFNRAQSLANLEEAGKYRLMHWQAAADLVGQHPLLGTGIGSQRFYFPKYYRPEFAVYEAPNTFLDYAHNDILDVLMASGFLGLTGYLYFIFGLFYFGLRFFLRKKDTLPGLQEQKFFVFALFGGLFGYLVSIQFSFHIMSTLLYFWLFAAIILILANRLLDPKSLENAEQKKINYFKVSLITVIFAVFVFCFWQANLNLFLGNRHFFQASVAKAGGDWDRMIAENKKALSCQSTNPYYYQEAAFNLYFASFNIDDSRQKLIWLNQGIDYIEKIPKQEKPIEAIIWLPWLESARANLTRDPSDFKKAEKSFEVAADFTPGNALVRRYWCDLKIYEQDWPAAKEKCETALSLYPDINHKHINIEHQQKVVSESLTIYLNLADIYEKLNEPNKSLEYCKQASRVILIAYPSPYPDFLKYVYKKMIILYQNDHSLEEAMTAARHAIVLWPDDMVWSSELSLLYEKAGQKDLSEFWRRKTEELQDRSRGIYRLNVAPIGE